MKKLRVTVEGKAYDVLVEILDGGPVAPAAPAPVQSAPLAAPVAAPAPTAAPAPKAAAPVAAGANDIISPLSGKVVSIDVKVGDAVTAGQQVATVEAMKMNTYINATKGGKVLSIHGIIGEGIEEGAVLIKLG